MNEYVHDDAVRTVAARLARAGRRPSWCVILGSGWCDAFPSVQPLDSMDYAEIPGLGPATVPGHEGRVVIADIEGSVCLAFMGRRHRYEGAGWGPVLMPVRIAHALEVERILLTNASGSLAPSIKPGSLAILKDHINVMGESPLTGMETGAWKARFPDQSEVYDPAMRNAIVQACRAGGFPAVEAVYAAVTGPTYETPSEVRALRGMGADIVGMSTVPEAMLANAFGMKTAAVSLVANFGAGISQSRLCHDDVLAMSRKAIPAMRRVLSAFLKTPVRTEV